MAWRMAGVGLVSVSDLKSTMCISHLSLIAICQNITDIQKPVSLQVIKIVGLNIFSHTVLTIARF
jgi:hypothetical protein